MNKKLEIWNRKLVESEERIKEVKKPLIKYAVPFIILLLILGGLFFLRPIIPGYIIGTGEITYSDSLNLIVNLYLNLLLYDTESRKNISLLKKLLMLLIYFKDIKSKLYFNK